MHAQSCGEASKKQSCGEATAQRRFRYSAVAFSFVVNKIIKKKE
jgi:hypothetical protein